MQAVVLSEHEPDAAVDIPQGDSSARLGHIRAPNSAELRVEPLHLFVRHPYAVVPHPQEKCPVADFHNDADRAVAQFALQPM